MGRDLVNKLCMPRGHHRTESISGHSITIMTSDPCSPISHLNSIINEPDTGGGVQSCRRANYRTVCVAPAVTATTFRHKGPTGQGISRSNASMEACIWCPCRPSQTICIETHVAARPHATVASQLMRVLILMRRGGNKWIPPSAARAVCAIDCSRLSLDWKYNWHTAGAWISGSHQ